MNLPALPTGREGRVLAAGLAVLLLAIVWFVFVLPLVDWYDARGAALSDRTAYAQRLANIVAELPQIEREAAAARLQAVPTSIILNGGSDAIAGAALESLIDGLAHDTNANLVSTEAMQAEQTGDFRRIGLHVTVRAEWDDLMQLLAAIERAEPRMSIGDVQIQAGPLGGPTQQLDMTFSAMAFRAGTASAADNAAAAAAGSGDNSQ